MTNRLIFLNNLLYYNNFYLSKTNHYSTYSNIVILISISVCDDDSVEISR